MKLEVRLLILGMEWMGFKKKTGVNIITIKVEKVKLEVGGFGSRGEKIRSKIDDVNSRKINVGSRDA
jgi:hypothetical protein